MNSGPSPREQLDLPLQPEWQQHIKVWRGLLVQCSSKPGRKRVHALRSLTLRVRAMWEQSLLEHVSAAAQDAFMRWKKEGKRLRRTLEPVRDADVCLARLKSLRNAKAQTYLGGSQLNARCLREIDELEGRLKRERQAESEKLMAAIHASRERLNRLSMALEKHMASGPQISSGKSPTAKAALQIFAGLVSDYPHLDKTNLHAYRKRLKQALYLAESSSGAGSEAARLALELRKITNAVGEWHDWRMLALKAASIFPGHSKHDGLGPVLKRMAELAFKSAVDLCQHSAEQLLQKAGETYPTRLRNLRKPVASVSGRHSGDEFLPVAVRS